MDIRNKLQNTENMNDCLTNGKNIDIMLLVNEKTDEKE